MVLTERGILRVRHLIKYLSEYHEAYISRRKLIYTYYTGSII